VIKFSITLEGNKLRGQMRSGLNNNMAQKNVNII